MSYKVDLNGVSEEKGIHVVSVQFPTGPKEYYYLNINNLEVKVGDKIRVPTKNSLIDLRITDMRILKKSELSHDIDYKKIICVVEKRPRSFDYIWDDYGNFKIIEFIKQAFRK